MKFVSKPVEIEAWPVAELLVGFREKWHELPKEVVQAYDTGVIRVVTSVGFTVVTLEGHMQARADDWLIKGLLGEFYPCKNEVFEQKYQKAGSSAGKYHQAQLQVKDFHLVMDQPVGDTPEIRDPELRAKLIMEEAAETANALTGFSVEWEIHDFTGKKHQTFMAGNTNADCEAPDLVKAIDGMGDLLYVVYGSAVAAGVNLAPYFNEIHRTNMLKATGPVREDGKRLKPEGWEPPRIAEILEDEIAKKF